MTINPHHLVLYGWATENGWSRIRATRRRTLGTS